MRTIQIQATPEQFKQIVEYAKKIGVEIVVPATKKGTSKKEEQHPHLLETDNYCKYLKNEIIEKYNQRVAVKDKIKLIL